MALLAAGYARRIRHEFPDAAAAPHDSKLSRGVVSLANESNLVAASRPELGSFFPGRAGQDRVDQGGRNWVALKVPASGLRARTHFHGGRVPFLKGMTIRFSRAGIGFVFPGRRGRGGDGTR